MSLSEAANHRIHSDEFRVLITYFPILWEGYGLVP